MDRFIGSMAIIKEARIDKAAVKEYHDNFNCVRL